MAFGSGIFKVFISLVIYLTKCRCIPNSKKLVQRLPASKIKVLDSVPGIFELCGQFVFASRKEKTTHREVALDLSPTTVTGTAV